MDLKQYLFEKLIKEERIIDELIKIDKSIHLGNISQDYLKKILLSNYITYDGLSKRINLITDGDITTVILVLYKYGPNINTINVNKRNIAINKWLIKSANEYFNKYYNVSITIDPSNDYIKYINDELLFVCGFSGFVKETKKDIKTLNNNINIVEIITK